MSRRRIWSTGILLGVTLQVMALLLGAAPVAAAPGEWWGDYFANPDLSGAPVLSRYDREINFTWGSGSPAAVVPRDNFSVRWVRDEWFAGGTYRFSVLSDDGVRIWVGDQLVVDEWRDRWATPWWIDRYIPSGTYRVKVEYYDRTGDATISVSWNRLTGGGGWRGEYFNNTDLKGAPVLTRDDPAIDFDWGDGGPDPAVGADDFSVRWTQVVDFEAGNYRFLASTDDGVRLWVDGTRIINAWTNQALPTTHTGDIYLAKGQHTVRVEYYERGGQAAAHVWWEPLDTVSGGWRGEYFSNRNLIGGPTLVRTDAVINFDWGTGAPTGSLPDDSFSVRWTRTYNFSPGFYRFVLRADDGARLWIDHGILIDKWQDMDYELHWVDGTYLQGAHTITLEYYEHTGNARVQFWWEPGTEGNNPPVNAGPVVPAAAAPTVRAPATPTPAPAVSNGPWQATYFDNASLQGNPVVSRVEPGLDFDWRWGSPDPAVPDDYFSARWTQTRSFAPGLYRFTTYTDDGVRLWIDGKLVVDSWRPMRGYRSATVRLAEGNHDIRMEYYERTQAARASLTWRQVGQ